MVGILYSQLDQVSEGASEVLSKHNADWQNTELTLDEFAKWIQLGGSYCAQLNGPRKTTNFLRSNIASVDIDGALTIQEALDHEFSKRHLSLLYTTASHSPENHRFRLVFKLDRTITSAQEQAALNKALGLVYAGDPSTHDACRMFFGNENSDIQVFGNQISSDVIDVFIEHGASGDRVYTNFDGVEISSRRSSAKIPKNTKLSTSMGSEILLGEVTGPLAIHCPFHNDKNPSALTDVSTRGHRYIHCRTCATTWWMESPSEEFEREFEETEFVKTMKALPEHADKHAGVRKIPDKNPKNRPDLFLASVVVKNRRQLELTSVENGLTLIRSPKGSGKTHSLAEIIKPHIFARKRATLDDYLLEIEEVGADEPEPPLYSKYSVLLIGHRQSLIRELCKRLSLNCYLDDKNFSYQEIQQRKKHYGVCLDSIGKATEIKYDLVLIDESEQVLAHLLSDTMKGRERVFKCLELVVGTASKVIALDADLGWTTYNTLTDMRKIGTPDQSKGNRVWVYLNEYVPPQREYELYASANHMIADIMTDIANGKKLFITSNNKGRVEKLAMEIRDQFGPNTAWDITSSNSRTNEVQQDILNITEVFNRHQVVIASPSLGTGIDITFTDDEQVVDCVYGIFDPLILSHTAIDQQIARVRHPKQVRVWISSQRFHFETEFGIVKRDLLLNKSLANTFIGFDPVTRAEIYNETDPFTVMAAHVVCDELRSKNNLRANFISYKAKNGWISIDVPIDEEKTKVGTSAMTHATKLTGDALTKNIIQAKPIDHGTYEHISEILEENTSLNADQLWSYIRISIEKFYQKTITVELIKQDEKGKLREQVRVLTDLRTVISDHSNNEHVNRNDFDLKFAKSLRFVKSRNAKVLLLYALLKASPIIVHNRLDTTVEYSTESLKYFGTACKQLRLIIQAQLDMEVRADIDSKPVTMFHQILAIFGLKTKKQARTTAGVKHYHYRIDPSSLEFMMELVLMREQTKDEWKFIHDQYKLTSQYHWGPNFKLEADN